MSAYESLKQLWKKFDVNGTVKNYSDVSFWVVETDTTGSPIARILPPCHKTPKGIDCEGFKRKDGKAIQRHTNWWKIYDFSTVEIYLSKRGLRISVISKTAVKEGHFGKNVKYIDELWGDKITVVLEVKRNRLNRLMSFNVSGRGWLDFKTVLEMTCRHEIDNARPVFPKNGRPYARSKRDKNILNNFLKRKVV